MLISFVGCDGVGKTTQSELICQWLKGQGLKVSILDKWAILDSAVNPEYRFIQKDLDLLRKCISEMDGRSRALFLLWAVSATEKLIANNPDSVFIADGYWHKHLASEVVFGNDKEWLYSIVEAFPKSDMVIYIKAAVSVTSMRKEDYTDYECGRIAPSSNAFVQHQEKLKFTLDRMAHEQMWSIVDGERKVNEVSQEIIKLIRQLF